LPDPDPNHSLFSDLEPQILQNDHLFTLMLIRILPFTLMRRYPDADTESVFHFDADADPDPASQNGADPCGSGSAILVSHRSAAFTNITHYLIFNKNAAID